VATAPARELWEEVEAVLREQSQAEMADYRLGDPGKFVPDTVDRPRRKRRRRRRRRSS